MTNYDISVNGSELADFARGLESRGIPQTSLNENVRPDELNGIIQSLSSNERSRVLDGSMRIFPRERRTFRHGQNTMTGIDYDLQRGIRVEPVRTDPYFRVEGPEPERSMEILREVAEEIILIDAIKSGLTSGIDSTRFRTSIEDYARLKDIDINVVYDKIVRLLISGSVTAMKSEVIPQAKPKQRVVNAMPIMAR